MRGIFIFRPFFLTERQNISAATFRNFTECSNILRRPSITLQKGETSLRQPSVILQKAQTSLRQPSVTLQKGETSLRQPSVSFLMVK